MATRPPGGATSEAFRSSLKDFLAPGGTDLIGRADAFFAWQGARRREGVWPYARTTSSAPLAHCTLIESDGTARRGVNFASQDYLSLSSHPQVKEAAIAAIRDHGVHSAGSAALLGNTGYSVALEHELSDFLGGRAIALFPTGWAAGYGAIQGFVRAADHVVLDMLSHSCLQAGARGATQNVHLHRHLDLRSLESRLSRIRASDTGNAILVVTESLFSMHSHVPDLPAMRDLCDRYDACLLVDCAHDLACIGDDGLGHVGAQGMLDRIDIVVGAFSKSLASNGGFVAVKGRAAAEYLKCYGASHAFSNALSPAQAATVLAALRIVRLQEGRRLRASLMANILELRAEMEAVGLQVLGVPSPIVPVAVGDEVVGRLMSRFLSSHGAIANLVEYPAVPLGQSRFRLQVMAGHSSGDIAELAALFRAGIAACQARPTTAEDDRPMPCGEDRTSAT